MPGVALVTGASSGIGRAICVCLSRNPGLRVVAVARRAQALEETKGLGPPGVIEPVVADVTTIEGRDAIVATVKAIGVPVTMLVQNAGKMGPIGSSLGPSDCTNVQDKIKEKNEATFQAAWHDTFELNVHAPLFLVRALFQEKLFDKEGARVLHIGSGAAHFTQDGWAAYCCTKSAFLMLSRCLQTDAATRGTKLSFGSVKPGIVESPMQEVIRACSEQDMAKVAWFRELKENEYQEKSLKPDETCANAPLPPPHCPPTDGLDTADNAAHFCNFLLTKVPTEEFTASEWDIRDSSHWDRWAVPK